MSGKILPYSFEQLSSDAESLVFSVHEEKADISSAAARILSFVLFAIITSINGRVTFRSLIIVNERSLVKPCNSISTLMTTSCEMYVSVSFDFTSCSIRAATPARAESIISAFFSKETLNKGSS